MSTHERELLSPVDLCTPDGLALNPDAMGWSRRTLHRTNLGGFFGRNKRWDYWGILAGDLLLSVTLADLDSFCLADVYWAQISTGRTGGHSALFPQGTITMPDLPSTTTISLALDDLSIEIADKELETTFAVSWTEGDGNRASLDASILRPSELESLNVVIPWHDELFNFTSKHWARPAIGTLNLGDERLEFGQPGGPEAWGVLDVGRGRWPAKLNWNWGGGAGRVGNHVVGLQFGAKWTEGSGFTENGILVDGKLFKIGRELSWTYDWENPLAPWRVVDPGGQLDVTLHPRFDKHSALDVSEDLGSETHQVFGMWSGSLVTDDGLELRFDGIEGFAEEARQRW